MSVSLTAHPAAGCLVEFMHGGQPVLAWVLDAQDSGSRLRVFTVHKREVKLPENRLLPWSGPQLSERASRSEMEQTLAEHHARRHELACQIDPLELWEFAAGEVPVAGAEFFAQLKWQDPDIDHIAAAGRALLEAKSHFKFTPPVFEVLTPEVVEAKLEEAERARVRQKLISVGHDLVRRIWDLPAGATLPAVDPEARERLAELLRARIAHPDDSETEAVWREIKKGLPDVQHLALIIARKWGLVAPHHNHLLDQAGYAWGDEWAASHQDEIDRQARALTDDLPEPEEVPFISVDSPTTRDIDDAFYVVREPDGGFTAQVALACPAFAWDFASELNEAVLERATSIYLPEGSSYMLPEELACDRYSLGAGQPRPGLVLTACIAADGEVLSREFRSTSVRVAENISYEEAEARIEAGSDPMAAAYEAAEQLRDRRLRLGAVIIERPDPEVSLEYGPQADPMRDEPRVRLELKPENPKAWLAVSEFMVLANEAAAIWARDNQVPYLYRTQNLALPSEFCGIWREPHDVHRVVKQFGPTLTELKPAPHTGLGLAAYASMTSPLRRYVDLIDSAQIHHMLTRGEPLFTEDRLAAMLPRLSARSDAAGQVQRFRPRYWKLLHFKQHPDKLWEAVATEEAGPFVNLALPEAQIFVRVPRDLVGEKFYPGKRFRIRFGKIDPLGNEIRVAEALEE